MVQQANSLPLLVEKAIKGRLGLPVKEFAGLVGVHANTVRRAALRGDIMTSRLGTKVIVPVSELIRILCPACAVAVA
jgi:hypothetical protein